MAHIIPFPKPPKRAVGPSKAPADTFGIRRNDPKIQRLAELIFGKVDDETRGRLLQDLHVAASADWPRARMGAASLTPRVWSCPARFRSRRRLLSKIAHDSHRRRRPRSPAGARASGVAKMKSPTRCATSGKPGASAGNTGQGESFVSFLCCFPSFIIIHRRANQPPLADDEDEIQSHGRTMEERLR